MQAIRVHHWLQNKNLGGIMLLSVFPSLSYSFAVHGHSSTKLLTTDNAFNRIYRPKQHCPTTNRPNFDHTTLFFVRGEWARPNGNFNKPVFEGDKRKHILLIRCGALPSLSPFLIFQRGLHANQSFTWVATNLCYNTEFMYSNLATDKASWVFLASFIRHFAEVGLSL